MTSFPRPRRGRGGFALVITLSLMILLALLAVGLLSLSAVSLRSSSQGEAMALARGNARLALLTALGELQKSAGPDQRATAPANLVVPSASPAVTGVWESWKPGPGRGDPAAAKKTVQQTPLSADGEFITWLASGNPQQPAPPTAPPGMTAAGSNPVPLVADIPSGDQTIRGVQLPPLPAGKRGAMAWTVLDEGVKARIDLPVEAAPANAEQRIARLRAPARPQPEAISGETAGLRLDHSAAARLLTLPQGALVTKRREGLRSKLHDLTPYSSSLAVNVADGGVKADLTRAFESEALPQDLAGRSVYSNTTTKVGASDPLFSTLAEHYQTYKKRLNPLQISVPRRYSPSRYDARTGQYIPVLAPLDGAVVAPVVSRVSVVFSLISRQAHSHWYNDIPNYMRDPERKHMVYLIYSPVVTVYNPYSVPIQFRDLKVTFRYLPVAFKFFRNGQAQNGVHTLLSTFHVSSQNRNNWEDPFSCTLSSTAGSASGTMITLYPGEARVFGVSHAANSTWGNMTNFLWENNLDSSKTKNIFAGAGWDYRSGFIVDWLMPQISQPTADSTRKDNNQTMGVFGVRPGDRVNVEVMPKMPEGSGGRFTVDFQAKVNNRDTQLGIYEYTYGTEAKLRDILAKGNHTTIGKVSYPFKRERDFTVSELTLSNPDAVPVSRWGSTPKQFAIITLGSRTAHDSLYPGKPGRTSSFVHHVLQMDSTKAHPALLPMELSLLPVLGAGANTVGSIDADDADRSFFFSGSNRGNGAIHHVSQELPTAPLVNLADLRHANLASGGYLPLVTHTVGESLASPMVPPDQVRGSTPFGYEALDHSFLANQTLWDGYFFSGLRNEEEAGLFFENKGLPLNPRLSPIPAPGTEPSTAAGRAMAGDAWANLAAQLAVRGGFNVNSTSKDAWVAMLSSLREMEIPLYGPVEVKDPSISPVTYRETKKTTENASFPRLSRPIGDRVTSLTSMDNQRRWSGFRELNRQELDKLAAAIVDEVRARGPFLSMSEFVNRRLGSETDERSARGALEEALRRSGVNDIRMGPDNRVISAAEAQSFGYANPLAAAGNTEEGASAILSQGDLLSVIGAAINVRSDTFVIRAYGDARDANNRIIATAWCEAVVQRMPAFVDPSDPPEKAQPNLLENGRKITDLSAVNRRFGRKFEILAFRWMQHDEL